MFYDSYCWPAATDELQAIENLELKLSVSRNNKEMLKEKLC